MYPRIRLENTRAGKTLERMLQSASIDKSGRIVRPLVFGFVVVDHGMKSAVATLVPMSEEYVYSKQYIEIVLSCTLPVSQTIRRLIQFLSENLPSDPSDVPDDPRAFGISEGFQDRRTCRGIPLNR